MAVKYKRKRLLVDNAFQLRLMVRMGGYFFLYILTMLHVGFVIEILQSLATDGVRGNVGDAYLEFLWKYKPLIFSFLLIAPVIFYDVLKFSNRVAGPLFRCRRTMADMAEGKAASEFVPRKGDLMAEFFQAFNALINAWNTRRITEQRSSNAPKTSANGQAEVPAPTAGV